MKLLLKMYQFPECDKNYLQKKVELKMCTISHCNKSSYCFSNNILNGKVIGFVGYSYHTIQKCVVGTLSIYHFLNTLKKVNEIWNWNASKLIFNASMKTLTMISFVEVTIVSANFKCPDTLHILNFILFTGLSRKQDYDNSVDTNPIRPKPW